MKRILVPTDFSDLATRALRHAGTIALHAGAEVTVLYADTFLPPPHFTSEQIPDLVQNIGIRVALMPLRVDFAHDPASGDNELRVGIAVGR